MPQWWPPSMKWSSTRCRPTSGSSPGGSAKETLRPYPDPAHALFPQGLAGHGGPVPGVRGGQHRRVRGPGHRRSGDQPPDASGLRHLPVLPQSPDGPDQHGPVPRGHRGHSLPAEAGQHRQQGAGGHGTQALDHDRGDRVRHPRGACQRQLQPGKPPLRRLRGQAVTGAGGLEPLQVRHQGLQQFLPEPGAVRAGSGGRLSGHQRPLRPGRAGGLSVGQREALRPLDGAD